jgi:hypothetical protein
MIHPRPVTYILTSIESSRRSSKEARETTDIILSAARPRCDSRERGSEDVLRADLVVEVGLKCAMKHIPGEIQREDYVYRKEMR